MKSAIALMSAYSSLVSSWISLFAFLCQGTLSRTMQYLLPAARGLHLINSLNDSIVVSKLNYSGFTIQSSPVSGLMKPL